MSFTAASATSAEPRSPCIDEPLLTWLRFLRYLFPIRHVLVVAPGHGSSRLVRFLEEEETSATLVEADGDSFRDLHRQTADKNPWLLHNQLVAPVEGETTFYKTTVAAADGLIHPDRLTAIWKRISIRAEIRMQAISLSKLIRDQTKTTNWLFLDCLPSLHLLESAAEQIAEMEVVMTRAPSKEMALGDSLQLQADFMEANNFRLIHHETDRNPQTSLALFARDYSELLSIYDKRNLKSEEKLRSAREANVRLQGDLKGLREELMEAERTIDRLFHEATRILGTEEGENEAFSLDARMSLLGSLLDESRDNHLDDREKLRWLISQLTLLVAYLAREKPTP